MASLSLHFPPRIYTSSSLSPIRASSNGGVPLPRGARSGGGVDGGGGGGGGGGPAVVEIPLEQIRRPLMRTRANDPAKVCQLMDSIRQIGLQEPIDVLEVDGVYYGEELFCAGERKAPR